MAGRIENITIDALSAHYDVLPTLIELCDLDSLGADFDGRSLHPLLVRRDAKLPERTVIIDSQRVEWPEKWKDSAVMTGRWRLIRGDELYDIETDPAQENDLADEYPDIVQELREDYEEWWDDITPFRAYSGIIVGRTEEPVTLTCHDWLGCEDVPWNQSHILEGETTNGFWAIDVSESGEYEIELRRWPPECTTPIDDIPADFNEMDYGSRRSGWTARATAIDPDTAHLRIAGETHTTPIPDDASAVTFRITLTAGPTRLQTWFEDQTDVRGAYFASVSRL